MILNTSHYFTIKGAASENELPQFVQTAGFVGDNTIVIQISNDR